MNDNIKLDKAHKTILTNLEFNSRIRDKELAKMCHLSKDAIRYRIKKLTDQGIITGYSCFVDYTKLGGLCYKIYLKIRGAEADWIKLRKFIDSYNSIFGRFEAQSDWNFGIVYFAKSLKDYYMFERELFTKFGDIIQSLELCQMLDAQVFEPGFLLDNKKKSFELFGEVKKTEVDDLDIKLLELLLRDSSLSLLAISNHIKLSPDATKKRIQRLEKEQVIRRCLTDIDYPKLGFETYKVFFWVHQYTEEIERKIISKLSNYNSISH